MRRSIHLVTFAKMAVLFRLILALLTEHSKMVILTDNFSCLTQLLRLPHHLIGKTPLIVIPA